MNCWPLRRIRNSWNTPFVAPIVNCPQGLWYILEYLQILYEMVIFESQIRHTSKNLYNKILFTTLHFYYFNSSKSLYVSVLRAHESRVPEREYNIQEILLKWVPAVDCVVMMSDLQQDVWAPIQTREVTAAANCHGKCREYNFLRRISW